MTIVETVTVRTRTYVAALGARFARTTPRERLLLGALVGGAILYAPVAALEARDNAETSYADALVARDTARRARVQAISATNRAAHDLALRDMADWGFEGGNLDIVRVRIEQALSAAATDVALTGVAIETNEAGVVTGPATWVSAQVQGDLLWGPTFHLLDEVAGWPEGVRITRFAFEKSPPPAFEGAPPALTPGRVTLGMDFPTRTAAADGPGT